MNYKLQLIGDQYYVSQDLMGYFAQARHQPTRGPYATKQEARAAIKQFEREDRQCSAPSPR